MAVYLQYHSHKVLLSLAFHWEVTHELHHGWTKKN